MRLLTKLLILILKGISRLPNWLLYSFSNGLTIFNQYIIQYRKDVIISNLSKCFPNLKECEVLKIQKQFYRFLSDFVVEFIKAFTISKKELAQSILIENEEVVTQFTKKNQPVVIVLGHYGNWELSALGTYQIKYVQFHALFREQKNEIVNQFIIQNRQRYGLKLISDKKPHQKIKQVLTSSAPNALVFVADQAMHPKRAAWLTFMNQKTTFPRGPEVYAKKYNCPILFGAIQCIKRGKYSIHFSLIEEQPQNEVKENKLLQEFATALEQQIKKEPPFWLWTHRRFKHDYAKWNNTQETSS